MGVERMSLDEELVPTNDRLLAWSLNTSGFVNSYCPPFNLSHLTLYLLGRSGILNDPTRPPVLLNGALGHTAATTDFVAAPASLLTGKETVPDTNGTSLGTTSLQSAPWKPSTDVQCPTWACCPSAALNVQGKYRVHNGRPAIDMEGLPGDKGRFVHTQ